MGKDRDGVLCKPELTLKLKPYGTKEDDKHELSRKGGQRGCASWRRLNFL